MNPAEADARAAQLGFAERLLEVIDAGRNGRADPPAALAALMATA
jgi:hypothetical protein